MSKSRHINNDNWPFASQGSVSTNLAGLGKLLWMISCALAGATYAQDAQQLLLSVIGKRCTKRRYALQAAYQPAV